MKKTIYLNKDYTIDDINEISELMDQKDYDIIDYSNCNVDEYIKILLDNYNSKYFLSNYSSEKKSLLLIYNVILNGLSYLFNLIIFCKILFKHCDEKFQRKYFYNNVIADIFDMAMDSIPVIIIFSLAFGFNLAVQTVVQLKVFSSMELQTMNIVTIALFKGIGLFIALIVLSAKYASGLIAKVGFMKITDEWDALTLMNIDPEIFFLKSKILAFIVLVPLCSYIAILFGIIGAFIGVSYHLNASYKLFVSVSELTFMMFLSPLIKGLVIGVVIGITSSYEAFNVKKSSDEILFALSRGVVTCIVLCIVVDLLLNFVLRSFI